MIQEHRAGIYPKLHSAIAIIIKRGKRMMDDYEWIGEVKSA